jgi:hypothetical protein
MHRSPPDREALKCEAYDGLRVVGMDLHRRRSVLVRMTADGRKLETAHIAKVAAARQLLTWVFYAMRDGQVRPLASPARKAA